jgi:hypothetical protein
MSQGRLKPWILLPMTTALGLVVVLIAIHRAGQQGIEVQAAERARLVQELLDQRLADETRSLTEALLLLQRDPALSRALAERDREALSRSAGPLFTRLAGELGSLASISSALTAGFCFASTVRQSMGIGSSASRCGRRSGPNPSPPGWSWGCWAPLPCGWWHPGCRRKA